MDIMQFDPLISTDEDGEHVRFTVHGEVFRLDVASGSMTQGPVRLTYLLERDWRLAARMDTIRRLEQCFAGSMPRQHKNVLRIARSVMALRAYDARLDGASLREIAAELLGPGEWPGPGEWRKSAARRLAVRGKKLIAQGPLPILAW